MYDSVQNAAAANARAETVRAGSRTLSIFGYSLNASVLRAHADGPMLARDLEHALGWAPPSSLRAAVGNLSRIGTLTPHKSDQHSHCSTMELTESGRDLLVVVNALERWLQLAPEEPLPFDHPAARGIVKVLTAGWDSTMVRALAERPLTLNELSAGIHDFSYPALKRRLAKLRATNLVVPVKDGGVTAYAANDWLRHSVAPLAAAASWELRHDPDAEPISSLEVEAAFMLTLPLIKLPRRISGRGTFAVLIPGSKDAERPELTGVAVEIEQGKIVSCTPKGHANADAWALGTAPDWLRAVIEGRLDDLRVDKAHSGLARTVVRGIHEALYRS